VPPAGPDDRHARLQVGRLRTRPPVCGLAPQCRSLGGKSRVVLSASVRVARVVPEPSRGCGSSRRAP
jgi:hypothetical protein